jgi:hypothetical protein
VIRLSAHGGLAPRGPVGPDPAARSPRDWDDPQAKENLVSDLVNDALAVLAELTGPSAPVRDDAAADALGLLALVAGQDVEPAGDSDGTDGRWRIARKVAPDRVISTVDRQARHTARASPGGGTGSGGMWPPSRAPGWSPTVR